MKWLGALVAIVLAGQANGATVRCAWIPFHLPVLSPPAEALKLYEDGELVSTRSPLWAGWSSGIGRAPLWNCTANPDAVLTLTYVQNGVESPPSTVRMAGPTGVPGPGCGFPTAACDFPVGTPRRQSDFKSPDDVRSALLSACLASEACRRDVFAHCTADPACRDRVGPAANVDVDGDGVVNVNDAAIIGWILDGKL